MTNTMIIFTESVRLMDEGVLKGTGEFVKMVKADGEEDVQIMIHLGGTANTITVNSWEEIFRD